MMPLVPQVHLFICLDTRISPGVILHALDLARAQDWKQETVLICDESWSHLVNIDQPVLFIDRERLFSKNDQASEHYNVEILDSLLEQLDHFEINQVTQIGDLNWGRWLTAYFEQEPGVQITKLNWSQKNLSSVQVINDMAAEMGVDLSSSRPKNSVQSAVYMDPYVDGEISKDFFNFFKDRGSMVLPQWLVIAAHEKDAEFFNELGLEDWTVDQSELEMSLFNQSVICFSELSPFVQTSRAYNIATICCGSDHSLFLPGDMNIQFKENIHLSELVNILVYWKTNRLKELAFQWLNMGIEIECIEDFHGRLMKRNLLNYSSDLFNSQILVREFVNGGSKQNNSAYRDLVSQLRNHSDNDPYSLSFSLKLLMMIVDRMIASAKVGERLFQRLGSDYHRLIIGEALIEGLIEKNSQNLNELKIDKKLFEFRDFLVQLDHFNDQEETQYYKKDSL